MGLDGLNVVRDNLPTPPSIVGFIISKGWFEDSMKCCGRLIEVGWL